MVAVNIALALCLGVSQASAEVFAYPKQGQSQQQFEQDQYACHQWAKGQTGADPASTAAPPQRGGAVRGAAGGAAVGAIGGAIGGDAGKGAAQAQQQAQANYDRAYAACLQGRGYQVQ
jgi:hypothetical protein